MEDAPLHSELGLNFDLNNSVGPLSSGPDLGVKDSYLTENSSKSFHSAQTIHNQFVHINSSSHRQSSPLDVVHDANLAMEKSIKLTKFEGIMNGS